MKTNLALTLSLAVVGFAAAALAGPSAPSTVRPGAKLFSNSEAAPAACPACKTTAIVVARTVGIPNKGQTVWTKVGTKHECALCDGAIMAKGDVTSGKMTHDAAKCGPKNCCTPAAK